MALGVLNPNTTALFVCDVQERFRDVMLNFSVTVSNCKKLISGCSMMDIPIVVTEQYPKGLGATVSELELDKIIISVKAEKTNFSMIVPQIEDAISSKLCKGNLASVILCGIETHVCVEQTALDLINRGLTVHVVADCCTSRTAHDRSLALQRLAQLGCFVTTYETVLFKFLGGKDHPKFKEVSQLLKIPSVDPGAPVNL